MRKFLIVVVLFSLLLPGSKDYVFAQNVSIINQIQSRQEAYLTVFNLLQEVIKLRLEAERLKTDSEVKYNTFFNVQKDTLDASADSKIPFETRYENLKNNVNVMKASLQSYEKMIKSVEGLVNSSESHIVLMQEINNRFSVGQIEIDRAIEESQSIVRKQDFVRQNKEKLEILYTQLSTKLSQLEAEKGATSPESEDCSEILTNEGYPSCSHLEDADQVKCLKDEYAKCILQRDPLTDNEKSLLQLRSKGSGLNILKANSVPALLGDVIGVLMGILGSVALALFVYAGLLWMAAAGNGDKEQKARDIMVWAGAGVIVILSSYALVRFVLENFI